MRFQLCLGFGSYYVAILPGSYPVGNKPRFRARIDLSSSKLSGLVYPGWKGLVLGILGLELCRQQPARCQIGKQRSVCASTDGGPRGYACEEWRTNA